MKVQLIIFLIVIVFGLIQTAYRAYQKKKSQLDAQKAEREREQAILRTGRDPLAEQAAAQQREAVRQQIEMERRQAEVMAQRQAALRELRREQQRRGGEGASPQVPAPQMSGGSGGGGGGGPITRELWPGGPVIVIGAPDSGSAPQPRPAAQPQSRAQQPKRQKGKQPRPQPVQAAREEAREDRHDDAYYERERTIARMRVTPADEPVRQRSAPIFVKPTTPQQWRAAFIASEVLGQPVSLRPQTSPF